MRRHTLGALLGLLVLQGLLVICFAYPAAKVAPHDLPVGVVGSGPVANRIAGQLSAQDGAFAIHRFAEVDSARAAIVDREVYGAIVVAPSSSRLLVASAASPAVANLLQQGVSTAVGHPVRVEDVRPADSDDPRGAALAASLLPIVITGVAGGAVLSVLVRDRVHLIGALATFAILGGLGTAAVVTGWLSAVPGYIGTAGVLALTLFAISATTAGFARLAGKAGTALVALTLVLIGNPGSGAASAPELLAQPWRALGPLLPPGAGTSLMRGVAFFDGAAIGGPLWVLGFWALSGSVLVLLTHRSRMREAATTGLDHDYEGQLVGAPAT